MTGQEICDLLIQVTACWIEVTPWVGLTVLGIWPSGNSNLWRSTTYTENTLFWIIITRIQYLPRDASLAVINLLIHVTNNENNLQLVINLFRILSNKHPLILSYRCTVMTYV
jgi:hypothetical protein